MLVHGFEDCPVVYGCDFFFSGDCSYLVRASHEPCSCALPSMEVFEFLQYRFFWVWRLSIAVSLMRRRRDRVRVLPPELGVDVKGNPCLLVLLLAGRLAWRVVIPVPD